MALCAWEMFGKGTPPRNRPEGLGRRGVVAVDLQSDAVRPAAGGTSRRPSAVCEPKATSSRRRPPPPPAQEPLQLVLRVDRRAELADAAPIARKGDRRTQQHAFGGELGDQAPSGLQRQRATKPRRDRQAAADVDGDPGMQWIERRRARRCGRSRIVAAGAVGSCAPTRRTRRRASRTVRWLGCAWVVAAGAISGHAASLRPIRRRPPSSERSMRIACGQSRPRRGRATVRSAA